MSPRDFYREGTAPPNMRGIVSSSSMRRDFIRAKPESTSGAETSDTGSSGSETGGQESAPPASSSPRESTTNSSGSSASPSSSSAKSMKAEKLREHLIEHLGYNKKEVGRLKIAEMRELVEADLEE